MIAVLTGCATPGAAPPLDAANESESGNEVVMVALAQVGVPYVNGGASPARGFDCSGLVSYAYRRARGIEVPRTTFKLVQASEPVADGDLQPGDLVFYNTLRRNYSHVGIYLGGARFVHAPTTGGVVRVEDMRLGYWTERFNGVRRITP